jgi:threonine aldolase
MLCAIRELALGPQVKKWSQYTDVVTFLTSAEASFVTGSIIRVDVGMLTNV